MRLNVFGRICEVTRENGQWHYFSLGEGKKRREHDIVIPAELSESEVITFVADMFHEAATPENAEVQRVD